MWYIKQNNQTKPISRCFIQSNNGNKPLTRLYFTQDSQTVKLELPQSHFIEGENINGGIAVLGGFGALFTNPGNYVFQLPIGVSKIHIVAIGAGGSGGRKDLAGSGGGGGGLAAVSQLTVASQQQLAITVGQGGSVDINQQRDGSNGSNSIVEGILMATGGQGGTIESNTDGFLMGGQGGAGTIFTHESNFDLIVTGTGGDGGTAKHNIADSAGGGGAAGYNGMGGQGGGAAITIEPGLVGTYGGGGGGGGAAHNRSLGGMGGGVGPFGVGSAGIGGASTSNSLAEDGGNGSIDNRYPAYIFGAGSGGQDTGGSNHVQPGQNGAVLISWEENILLL